MSDGRRQHDWIIAAEIISLVHNTHRDPKRTPRSRPIQCMPRDVARAVRKARRGKGGMTGVQLRGMKANFPTGK